MTWGFRAHDLDIDSSNSHLASARESFHRPRPEEIVERTVAPSTARSAGQVQRGCGRGRERTALLLQVDEVIDGLRSTPLRRQAQQGHNSGFANSRRAGRLREAARAAVRCVRGQKDDEDGLFCCDCGAEGSCRVIRMAPPLRAGEGTDDR